ncbi:hypothetical protein HUF18_13965 [Thalassolituus sp. ST750PaO-4]|uniref:hypothetical protein n=1 Tax=Thalassolituus sp. ST750PaO-4 TaxID=2742965 RepID=UPI001CE268D7|nr:hypothetical protein [Thalassolituus sp. ST750PaO-4]MCA6060886.1 hypothetical protein [Thalassolituus sp. ST750PaO-4]
MFSLSRISLLLSVCLLAACSGNSSSTTRKTEPVKYVNGYLGSSSVQNAVIQAVPVDVQGQTATEIITTDDGKEEVYVGAKASSTTLAYYQVKLGSDDIGRPITLIVAGKDDNATVERCELVNGCYDNWGYRTSKAVPAEYELRASVGNAQNNMRINANWVTHLASALAYTSYIDNSGDGTNPDTPKAGVYSPFTIERANLWLNALFDLSDVISLRPLAPSELYKDSGLASAIKQESILYGAIVAAGQQLAKEAGQDQVDWLADMVDEFLHNQGQLYQRSSVATSFSLYRIYSAAKTLLQENRTYIAGQNYSVPSELAGAIAVLDQRLAALEDKTDQLTNINIPASQVSDWLDRINNARAFMADLNERLVNYKGQHVNTCPAGTPQTDTSCVHSFIDPAYVEKTVNYYNALNSIYDGVAPQLSAGTGTVKDLVLGLIACVHASCPSEVEGGYDAVNKKLTAKGLTLTLVPVELGADIEDEGKYNAFDIQLLGELIVDPDDPAVPNVPGEVSEPLDTVASIKFKEIKTTNADDEEVKSYSRVRIVYSGDEGYEIPPDPIATPPLGYDLEWPDVEVPAIVNGVKQEFSLYLSAKLIGVNDVLTENSPLHYNLTSVAVSLVASSDTKGTITEDGKEVELKDLAQVTLSAEATNAANYYSDSVWPELDDFFRVRSGYESGLIEPDLFEYRIMENQSVLFSKVGDEEVYRQADYIDFNTKGYGINRLEFFSDDGKGPEGLRNCSVIEDESGARETSVCTQVSEEKDLTIQELIDKDRLELFSIQGRGAYKPLFPDIDDDGSYELIVGSDVLLDGELKAVFSQGINELHVRAAHELTEGAGDNVERAPLAIVDVKLTRTTKDVWELAVAAGYDYDYLVDVLPTGPRAQSLYLSYLVGNNSVKEKDEDKVDIIRDFTFELGGLIIYRGGVKLFTSEEKGESIGVTLASRVDYELNGSGQPCGVINRKDEIVTGSCNAVGYLTYRNSIVGVIREERDGIYVVRFSDGQFLVLGG